MHTGENAISLGKNQVKLILKNTMLKCQETIEFFVFYIRSEW